MVLSGSRKLQGSRRKKDFQAKRVPFQAHETAKFCQFKANENAKNGLLGALKQAKSSIDLIAGYRGLFASMQHVAANLTLP